MLSESNLKAAKSTVLGILIIAAAVAYPFLVENINVWVFSILVVVGISLLFLPDTLFNSLKKLMNTNSDKKF